MKIRLCIKCKSEMEFEHFEADFLDENYVEKWRCGNCGHVETIKDTIIDYDEHDYYNDLDEYYDRLDEYDEYDEEDEYTECPEALCNPNLD